VSKYYLEWVLSDSSVVKALDERPTQEEIKAHGLGEYLLRKEDGRLIKRFIVALNRNNNPAIAGHSPVHLEGISTLNLNRMVKAYGVIVKNWPAKQTDLTKIANELQKRADLLDTEVSS